MRTKRTGIANLTSASHIVTAITPDNLELSGAAQCICTVRISPAASLCDPMTFCQASSCIRAAILLRADKAAPCYERCRSLRTFFAAVIALDGRHEES
jgi:hypothetical protein